MEKIAEENLPLAAMFPLKLCAISGDDLGLMLVDDLVVYPAGGERILVNCKREVVDKILTIMGGLTSFYGRGIIPKDFKTKINFRSIGGTPFYGSSPEKSDLIHYDDGFKGHISVEDGKVSYMLGLAEDAKHEVAGPFKWITSLLIGLVDVSEVEDDVAKEYVGYMEKMFSKVITTLMDEYPQYALLKEEWLSMVKDECHSDEKMVEIFKVYDGGAIIDIINIPFDSVSKDPKDIMDTLLAPYDPAVKSRAFSDDEGKLTIFLQWKDGKVDLRVLKPEEEVSSTFKVTLDYEETRRMTTGETSFLYLFKTSDLRVIGSGKDVLPLLEGLVLLFHYMWDGLFIPPMMRRRIKG